MSLKTGYRRLAIACCGSWIAAFATTGAYAAWQQGIWSAIYLEDSRLGRPGWHIAAVEQRRYGEMVADALFWCAGVVPLAALFAVGWWVIVGFRAR